MGGFVIKEAEPNKLPQPSIEKLADAINKHLVPAMMKQMIGDKKGA